MQEWKASEKEAQKMTRDGAISVNLVTGEATHISDRPSEQDYSSADDTAETSGRVVDEMEGHVERRQAKKVRHKRRDTFREGEAARDRPSSRLQFSEADRAAPELKKAVRKSDKAADKLDAAKAAVGSSPMTISKARSIVINRFFMSDLHKNREDTPSARCIPPSVGLIQLWGMLNGQKRKAVCRLGTLPSILTNLT